MQHILRCWERQSDGSEYKTTLRRPGLRRGPRSESLQRSRKPPSYWVRAACPLPKNPIPPLSALRTSPLLPHSKISSDAVGWGRSSCDQQVAASTTGGRALRQRPWAGRLHTCALSPISIIWCHGQRAVMLCGCRYNRGPAWWKIMAAYRRVCGFGHLWADCRGPGSAPETLVSITGLLLLYL